MRLMNETYSSLVNRWNCKVSTSYFPNKFRRKPHVRHIHSSILWWLSGQDPISREEFFHLYIKSIWKHRHDTTHTLEVPKIVPITISTHLCYLLTIFYFHGFASLFFFFKNKLEHPHKTIIWWNNTMKAVFLSQKSEAFVKKPIKVLKKPTGLVRFLFYKPETEKTKPKKTRIKPSQTGKNQVKPVFVLKIRAESNWNRSV